MTATIFFHNRDALIGQATVIDGAAPENVPTPSYSDAQYTYTFAGWSSSNNDVVEDGILNGVEIDKHVYAAYTKVIRTYRVRFYNGTTLLATFENVPYGTTVEYDTVPDYYDANEASDWVFRGWTNDANTIPITGNTDCYSDWRYIGFFYKKFIAGQLTEYEDTEGLVTYVGETAFRNYTTLKSISLPAAQTVNASAFNGASNLESVSLPNVVTVRSNAFYNCTKLKSITLPLATLVENSAFGFSGLESVSLPELETVPQYMLRCCYSVKNIHLSKAKTIGYAAFESNRSVTSISLPEVTTVAKYTFMSWQGCTQFDLPKLENITELAFSGCSAVQRLDLPRARKLDTKALGSMSHLKWVRIGGTANDDMFRYASIFDSCPQLEAIVIDGVTSVPQCLVTTFNGSAVAAETCYIYVPANMVEAFKTADYWSTYANQIRAIEDYTDEGITGTSTKRREGFKRMIADALDGRIDLIVTKSVSRFARNTVDSLTTIRQLKENGIEVYFEKENIWTFDGKGEVLLTIMSSLAQEESRSISENCTWGQRKRFADGKVTVPFKRFLGYDRGEDGNLVVNPEQADVVKRIYGMFLKGMTPHGIAKTLTDEGVPTPAGKRQWGQTTIKSILSNEKYKGDALLQKTFCEDFLTKKMKTNQGEVPQYYVENNHEAIIDPQTFEMVQRELARRTKGKNRHSGVHLLSGRIKCGDCGGWYGSKVWHSPEKCKRTVWQCNQKYKNEVRCTTPYLDEASVKERFTAAVNQLLAGRDAAIAAYEQGMAQALDTTELEAQQQELLDEMEILNSTIQQMIRQNATVAQDQADYNRRFDSLSKKFKDAEAKKAAVTQQISDILDRRGTMEDFLRILKQQDGEITAFSEKLWCGLLDYATAYADGRLSFTFKNGSTFEG